MSDLDEEPETCKICPQTRAQHRKAEEHGLVKHRFSEEGELNPIETAKVGPKKEEKKPPEGQGIYSVPGGDPVLRMILINRGLISVEDIDSAEKMLQTMGVMKSGPDTRNDE